MMPEVSLSKPVSPILTLCDTSSELTPGVAIDKATSRIDAFRDTMMPPDGVRGSNIGSSNMSVATSDVRSQMLASSAAVYSSRSLPRRTRVLTSCVNLGRTGHRSAHTTAEAVRLMLFSERSTPPHSFPRTTKNSTSFLEKRLRFFNMPLKSATPGFCISRMAAKFSADANQEDSRNDRFRTLYQTFRGSNSKLDTVSCSRDWHCTRAMTSFASCAFSTAVSFRPSWSASKFSMMTCFSVCECLSTWISSWISPMPKSQKLRFQTPLSSPQPFRALTASCRKPSGTRFACAPMAMSFLRSPSSLSPRVFVNSMPSLTSSTASAHFPSLTFRRAALWHARTR
mmetsp:Transcript_54784/g.154216  ORF Transcript_54784/g.154216 Transcript_54784/m.154216 type:complete len:341 (-) Transcript_54784:357-1379(-)